MKRSETRNRKLRLNGADLKEFFVMVIQHAVNSLDTFHGIQYIRRALRDKIRNKAFHKLHKREQSDV